MAIFNSYVKLPEGKNRERPIVYRFFLSFAGSGLLPRGSGLIPGCKNDTLAGK
jgi:hypothetical protein